MTSTSTPPEEKKHCHYFDNDEFLNPYDSGVICLAAGALGPSLLKKCVPMFEKATLHRMNLEKDNAYLFQYGTNSGLWEYRDELSKFLTKHYGDKVNRQDLILTSGATQGLTMILNTLLPSDAVIFIEEVTYMAYFDVFKIFSSMKLVSVPMTEEGIDTGAFEKIVACEKSKRSWDLTDVKLFWAMLYTIPIIHNPTGITASENCCKEIVRIARKMNILVLAEDVHNLLYYGDEKYPPKRLFSYDGHLDGFNGGNVISSATFTKILSPGLKLGWMETGPCITKVLKNVGILKSAGAVNQYMSGIMASVFELGLMDSHLETLVKTLKDSMTAVCNIFDEHLPKNCKCRRPDGSFFVWIQLPETMDAEVFIPWCVKKYKVNALPGHIFSLEGKFKNYMRITTAFYEINVLKEGAWRMCCAIAEFVNNEKHL